MEYRALTPKQNQVFEIIVNFVKTNAVAPTIREIQQISEIRSLRGITIQLEALEKQKFIIRKTGARGIFINPQFLTEAKDENMTIPVTKTKEEKISIPIMTALIPAGPVSYVEACSDDNINVPSSVTRGMRNVFAVRVSGDSMAGAGIVSGDIAIIAPQPVANDGDIVAALHDEGITLKKFRVIEGRPILMPANPNYEPITNNFSIQGKLLNIIKSEK